MSISFQPDPPRVTEAPQYSHVMTISPKSGLRGAPHEGQFTGAVGRRRCPRGAGEAAEGRGTAQSREPPEPPSRRSSRTARRPGERRRRTRSSSSTTLRGGYGIAVPQLGQNLAPPATLALHFGQVLAGAARAIVRSWGRTSPRRRWGFRTSGSGGPAGACPAGPIGFPHEGQNRIPAGTIALHFGQGEEGPALGL